MPGGRPKVSDEVTAVVERYMLEKPRKMTVKRICELLHLGRSTVFSIAKAAKERRAAASGSVTGAEVQGDAIRTG